MKFGFKVNKTISEEKIKFSDNTVYIRPITYEDTDNIVRWRNSDGVRLNFIYQGLFTNESHEKWLREQVETGKVVQFIICLEDGDIPVGSVYIRDIEWDKGHGEYGIFIGEESARGKGVGSRTAKIMVDVARNNLSLNNLFLRVYADNISALKSYEKAGFVCNGESEILNINGADREVVFMELK